MLISVVVPVLNEAGNVRTLVDEISMAAKACPISEIIYVDDGSTDETRTILAELTIANPSLRIVCHAKRLGQSAAFLSGGRAATGKLLAFIDGDLQNDPADIVRLFAEYRELSEHGIKVAVLGERGTRRDSGLRRISSRVANRIRAAMLRDGTRDTGCSLKLMAREDFLALPYFDHMHRFLPSLLIRNNVQLAHVHVSHRPRVQGRSKYGFWDRALTGAFDLLGAAWLQRRRLPRDYAVEEITRVE